MCPLVGSKSPKSSPHSGPCTSELDEDAVVTPLPRLPSAESRPNNGSGAGRWAESRPTYRRGVSKIHQWPWSSRRWTWDWRWTRPYDAEGRLGRETSEAGGGGGSARCARRLKFWLSPRSAPATADCPPWIWFRSFLPHLLLLLAQLAAWRHTRLHDVSAGIAELLREPRSATLRGKE